MVHISDNQNLDSSIEIKASGQPEPGSIVLLDPSSNVKRQVYSAGNFNFYPYGGLEICIKPREGLLIMFPQYLEHLVTPTGKENFQRFSLAFNINKK